MLSKGCVSKSFFTIMLSDDSKCLKTDWWTGDWCMCVSVRVRSGEDAWWLGEWCLMTNACHKLPVKSDIISQQRYQLKPLKPNYIDQNWYPSSTQERLSYPSRRDSGNLKQHTKTMQFARASYTPNITANTEHRSWNWRHQRLRSSTARLKIKAK